MGLRALGLPDGASPDVPVRLSRVLVVSGSSVFRDLMHLILAPHVQDVLFSRSRKEGVDRIFECDSLDVVLCDVSLPDGDGFELLEDVADIPGARPDVILIASQALTSEAHLASQMGAVGYLAKPISFPQIARALKQHGADLAPREPRRRPGGRVCLLGMEERIAVDAADPQLLWYARDLSTTGAFIETESPLPMGSRLDLAIEVANVRIRLQAEVVRIQQPSWGSRAGVGVRFLDHSSSAREALEAYISQGGDDTY